MDWSCTTKAKSDQLNADDLISNSVTIKITKVEINMDAVQKGVIHYEGDNGKPYKPCLLMRRAIEFKWGCDETAFVGRYMTLVRDATVKWGGEEVGGIRIKSMTHMKNDDRFMLTFSRNMKRSYKIEHLKMEQQSKPEPEQTGHPITDADYENWTQKMDVAQTLEQIQAVGAEIGQVSGSYNTDSRDRLKAYYADRLNTIKGENS